ncbi:MAG: hypothetical protein HC875_33175 [Anaerolineales bacterium]|nr:hypothetical protein [Anaerolineales bacterium]
MIGQSLLKHNIQLRVDFSANLPPLKGSGQQLQQVLLNLLFNAKDALNEKYPDSHPDKRIIVCARTALDDGFHALASAVETPARQVIRFSVRDEGTGITPDHLEQIFTPFFTTKRPNRGTGLGLSISHKIIENHQGRIEVNSQPGAFTEFVVILPVNSNQTPEGDPV